MSKILQNYIKNEIFKEQYIELFHITLTSYQQEYVYNVDKNILLHI